MAAPAAAAAASPTALRRALEAALSAGYDDEAALRAAVAAALGLETAVSKPEPEPEARDAVPQIIMDCDPGGDDVFALFWLLALSKQKVCDIRAVTTTEGNVKAPLTFAAADKVLQLLSSAVPGVEVAAQTPAAARHGDRDARAVARRAYAAAVATGAAGGGDGFSDAAHIHGCDGMGGLSRHLASGTTRYTDAEESYERLIRELEQRPGEITILATGPLTNLADAERARPGVLRKARRIIIMGGALPGTRGNITPLAEFNFAFDAAAAALVMEEAGLEDIVLMPLDVTTKLVCTEAMVTDALLEGRDVARRGMDSNGDAMYEPTAHGVGQFLHDLSSFMFKTALQFKETDGTKGFLVHDASTILALFYPECLQFTRAQVSVAVSEQRGCRHGIDTNGMSFIDRRHCPKLEANAWVGTGIDAAGALSIMIEDLKQLVSAMPSTLAVDAACGITATTDKVSAIGAAPA